MGLSRLSQLLSNTTGRTLYVNPDSIDSTDAIENRGNSPTRPFYSLNRAIAEAVRFSYQIGLNNDRFSRCTIILAPGIHRVTNRPGWIPDGANNFRLRDGTTSSDFPQWDSNTNFDITTENNALYKLNSVHGGIFLPRGVSIIGQDYRKTIIVPDYVPNPEDDTIERAAVFLLTGQNFINEVTIDDPDTTVYKDYTKTRYTPLFSQHKLTNFEYADGVNVVSINDGVLNYTSTRTDLQMYYEKIGLVFGPSSGREIQPDYPSTSIDIQPRLDEYRIVGSRGKEVAISTIISGNGVTPSKNITVTLAETISELDIDTPIRIQGVSATGYDGQYVVKQVLSPTQIVYEVATPPVVAAPSSLNATLNISVDTVSSASPYLFNIASKTVWGRCSLHADGSKVSGFKSVVVAQYTGIGLQKDPNAFVKYNSTLGIFEDKTVVGNENIQTNSRARYKPTYENYHIKASNDGYIQVVSVFAIGYSHQFLSESGADQSINASNSNFGAKALTARGYRESAFIRDDAGYVTHVIPPKEIGNVENTITYESLDVGITTSVGISSQLYFYNRASLASPPDSVVEGYRVGARRGEQLKVIIGSTEYAANILMPNSTSSAEKIFTVSQDGFGVNNITANTITLTQNHTFINGESVRMISSNGQLPDGITANKLYFIITTGSGTQIKLAQTLNDAISGTEVTLNNSGGTLTIASRVSDKNAGDIGHPLQYNSSKGWYINVATGNDIYNAFIGLSDRITRRTYLSRKLDGRGSSDTIYKLRYVIPSSAAVARPPLDGYIIQESNNTIGSSDSEVASLFNPSTNTLSSPTQLRNQKLIANATWSSGTATFTSELYHNLSVGSYIRIKNVKSTNNTTGADNVGYNGSFLVTGISNRRTFTVALSTDPGTFTNNTSTRTLSSPYFSRRKYQNIFYVYRTEEIQTYISGKQDGIYYLTVLNAGNSPTDTPFTNLSYSQPVQNLFPQVNRDNPTSDPKEATSFALSEPLGQVIVNEPEYSITRESIQKVFLDGSIGIGLTNIISNSAGTAHTIYTAIDHGLDPITAVSITNAGTGYGVGSGSVEYYYNARLENVSSAGENATARITVSSAGAISSVRIMSGGSNYNVGDSLRVVGIATTTGYTAGIVSVATIYNHVGESLKVSKTLDAYNTSYLITGITSSKSINVSSAASITSPYVSGIGSAIASQGYAELTGPVLGISTIAYSSATGIATIVTTQNHGLNANNKILLGGFTASVYNATFTIDGIVGINSFTIATGSSLATPVYTGTPKIYRQGASSSGGTITKDNENLSGRMVPIYGGITTSISSSIDAITTTIPVPNAASSGLKIGDYLLIDSEIIRISTTVTSSSNVTAFRGVLGTRNAAHSSGSVVYKISPTPIELRRNSLIRASAHTFEYNGFGPGNYSSALPDRQDRTLSPQEELIAQSTKEGGGIVVFSGMNSDGDFYVGNKKVSSATGTEEIFDTPIISVTGEDSANVALNDINTSNAFISKSLYVEGGTNKNSISQFDGPAVFNNKIISNSPKGIEALNLYLQGTSSSPRQYTVGDSIPTIIGTPGDVQYNSNPLSGGFLGWVFTTNGVWEKFGRIGSAGGDLVNNIGVSNNSSFVGLSTLLDIKTTGIVLTSSYDTATGITTLNFAGASPLGNAVGLSTGNNNSFVGMATQINIKGTSNIDILGSSVVSGVGTITVGISSNSDITATAFIKKGATATNFLRASGVDSALTSSDITNALGYVPANSASIVGDPAKGNSVILDALSAFDGVTTTFNLFLNGVAYTPFGSEANLIVSLGGIIQKPGTDYLIPKSGGNNTSTIQFTTAPQTGLSCFITALGGQSTAGIYITQTPVISGYNPVVFTTAIGATNIVQSSNYFTFSPAYKALLVNGSSKFSVLSGTGPYVDAAQSGNLTNNRYVSHPYSFANNSADSTGIVLSNNNSEPTADASLAFLKNRGGAQTENGDALGNITFQGYSPTLPANVYALTGAAIKAFQDGATQLDRIPGRLSFFTTPTGIGTTVCVERLTIKSNGNIGFANTNPVTLIQVGTGSSTVSITGIGSVGIGTTNPSCNLQVIGSANISGNVTAGTFSGDGITPLGGIIMWSGTVAAAAALEPSWALCDGRTVNGKTTPDLRNRFIVGAGTDSLSVWGYDKVTGIQTFTGGQTSVGVGSTGGSIGVGMTVGEMPTHTHPVTLTFNGNGYMSITNQGTAQSPGGQSVPIGWNNYTTISGNTGIAGSSFYHENRPPYYALAFIMRTR